MTDVMHESDFLHETPGQRIARRLVADMRAGTAGATEWIGEEPKSGYLVGIPALHITPNLAEENIESLIATWIDVATRHDYDFVSVGIWLNPNGSYDLDFCTLETTFAGAIESGRDRGELAIWHIADQRSVDVF